MNHTKRRHFLAVLGSGAAATLSRNLSADESSGNAHLRATDRPLVISTWPFGKGANDRALEILKTGGSPLDAVENGINVIENDPAITSVGLHGQPNADGVVQLDACIMDGSNHKAGSVAALEGIANPVSVARRVMEKTKNVMLVGAGAQKFALQQGFNLSELKSGASPKAAPVSERNHDTIALIVLDPRGSLAGGCSTSGLAGKLPGRVGDSPIIGSGLYVDGDVGGAAATGMGENVMRFCATFMIVEFMRQGMHPAEACIAAIKRIQKKHPPGTDLQINFVALNKQGEYGAAGTRDGFPYAVATPKKSQILASEKVP
jgi:isoaspartyl peptidase/L-asparaginase-like protein (Ntn-hydrolase superfamily)